MTGAGNQDISAATNDLFGDPFGPLATSDWTGLMFEIETRLYTLAFGGSGYLVLNVDRPDDPFVQFVVHGVGSIEAEAASTVVGDETTQERRTVDAVTERRLLRLGWRAPNADPFRLARPSERPNFHRSWTEGFGGPSMLFAEVGVRTLREAFEVDDPSLVQARGGYLLAGELPVRW